MIAKGRDTIIGARSTNAKLTDEQVAEIRRIGAPWVRVASMTRKPRGTATLLRQIAKRFGVKPHTIKQILRNERRTLRAA